MNTNGDTVNINFDWAQLKFYYDVYRRFYFNSIGCPFICNCCGAYDILGGYFVMEDFKFKVGDTVHLDFVGLFRNRDGKIIETVWRDKNWKHRDKYLVEIEYKRFGLFTVKKREWFVGTNYLARKV